MSGADYFLCPLRLLDGVDQTIGPAARVQRRAGHWATGQLDKLAKGGKLKHRRKFQIVERMHSDVQGACGRFRDESWSRVIASWVGDRNLVSSDFCCSPAANLALTIVSEANRGERAFLFSARACRDQRSCVANHRSSLILRSIAPSPSSPTPMQAITASQHRRTDRNSAFSEIYT
jgi:hypothetical protein